jgi:deoxyribonuclease V
MFLCLDVAYENESARAAGLAFSGWADAEPLAEYVVELTNVAPYVPGEFYLRELPCLLKVIEPLQDQLRTVLIDGYVDLAPDRPGLGWKLFEALGQRITVVGIAKTAFAGATHAQAILRGGSQRPLFVTAAGMPLEDAVRGVTAMHGRHRIPTLLKRVDQLARGSA